jgi:HprK-related kinase A
MLTATELERRLRGSGLGLRTGAFVTLVRSSVPSVAEGIGALYADFPLEDSPAFADFHVSVETPRSLRRWLYPQVVFDFDGHSPFKPLPFDQAFPMFEWGLNWCVSSNSHQYLIIHAAVMEKDGFAVIMPAPPGSGKSTLCAALVNRGWRLLSDELALIRKDDGQAVPLPRPVSLKNASIEVIRSFEPTAFINRECRDTMKGTVAHMKPPPDSVARAQETAQPGWVIFPRYQKDAATLLEPRPKGTTLMAVADNAFNYSLHGAAGFHMLADMIDACDCYDFTYSNLDQAIEVFAALQPPAP